MASDDRVLLPFSLTNKYIHQCARLLCPFLIRLGTLAVVRSNLVHF